jgi:type 1 fimbria pilin
LLTRSFLRADETTEIEMKTIIAALALVFLAASPTFAASAQTLHSRGEAYVPQSGYLGGADTSRESQIRAF